MIRLRSWAATHPGAVRGHNEDSLVDRPDAGLWAVADGAGGHQSGELASDTITRALSDIPSGLPGSEMIVQVRAAVAGAHEALLDEAARRGPQTRIASTVAVLLTHAGHFACLWAGDSRIYLMRGGVLQALTRDHSLVQELVESGVLRAEDADTHPHANVITRAVGLDGEAFELDKVTDRMVPGDRFLLCSDGVFKALDETHVARLVQGASPAEQLIDAALQARARDNITAVIVEAETGGDDLDAS